MSRFDPDPDKPYGECADCPLTFDTAADARQHMSDTHGSKGNSSHSVRVTNSPRSDRIHWEVRLRVDDAINDAMEQLDRYVQSGDMTDKEIAEALRLYPDFADSWAEWVEEGER